jgi:tripartite ATP-independent transporter DctM subunit
MPSDELVAPDADSDGRKPDSPARNTIRSAMHIGGYLFAATAVFLPFLNFFSLRLFRYGIPGSLALAVQSVLVLAFIGSILASFDGDHLSLTKTPHHSIETRHRIRSTVVSFSLVMVEAAMVWATLSFALLGFAPGDKAGFVPFWLLALSMPAGFGCMMVLDLRRLRGVPLVVSLVGVLAGTFLASASVANIAFSFGFFLPALDWLAASTMPVFSVLSGGLAVLLIVAVFMGMPMFGMFLGLAAVLFVADGSLMELAVTESYGLLGSPQIAAVPLFTLTGFMLAGTGAGTRLVSLFRAAFGRMSGGAVVATVTVCAFFSIFTGSSGVAILALGPLLAKVLIQAEGLGEERARGLLTASGSIGLLFPPSLAVIIYAVTAQFSYGPDRPLDILALFRGGILPGLLFIAVTAGAGIVYTLKDRKSVSPRPADPDSPGAFKALLPALPEVFLPFGIAILFFSGTASLIEIAALSVVYVGVTGFVRKEFTLPSLGKTISGAFPVIGGTLLLLAAARAFSYFLIDASIPELAAGLITSRIGSKVLFLLFLNLLLLAAGCLMDVFSAILVLAPLVIPIGDAFGVHPIHLGIIFIANLTVGFLTPPIGMNLFLASYAFGKPVGEIWRAAAPWFVLQLAVVLLITYVPAISLIFV